MSKLHDPRITGELTRVDSLGVPGFLASVLAYETFAASVDAVVKFAGYFNTRAKQSVLELFAKNMIDAASPMNTLLNPVVLRKAVETGGQSLRDGFGNFVSDVSLRGGVPLLADDSFQVGLNLAMMPGDVVLSCDLFDLIRYRPTTKLVHEVPLLVVPPPIGRWYIMDLTAETSYIKFMVGSGHEVYAINWCNPDAEMDQASFEGYILRGVVAALNAVPAPKVNVAGVCLGGTMAAIATALDNQGDDEGKINTLSNIVTLTDFGGDIGPMGAMITAKALDKLSAKNSKAGIVTAKKMKDAFAALNVRDLILVPMVQQWLLGEKPRPSALLSWNADGTNLFSTMHTQYLRACYLENRFAHSEFEVGEKFVGIGDITVDTFWVGGESDHIVYWNKAFEGASQTSGERCLVLSSRGHLGAIIDPPSDRASFLVGPSTFTDAASWKAAAEKVKGSWWEYHVEWLQSRSGRLVLPSVPAEILYAVPSKRLSVVA